MKIRPIRLLECALLGRRKVTNLVIGGGLFILLVAICRYQEVYAQIPLRPREPVKLPTHFGSTLLHEFSDFRLSLFERTKLDDRAARGVICVVNAGVGIGEVEDAAVNEYSTNQCQKVADALRRLGILERSRLKPQVRVVQKDAILQSTVGPRIGAKDGYSSEFLEHKLSAGDVVVLTVFE